MLLLMLLLFPSISFGIDCSVVVVLVEIPTGEVRFFVLFLLYTFVFFPLIFGNLRMCYLYLFLVVLYLDIL